MKYDHHYERLTHTTIAQITEFIKVANGITFRGSSRKEKYSWIENVVMRFRYFSLLKKERSMLKAYMRKMTGYSDAQLTRLIAKKRKSEKIVVNTRGRHRFPMVYTSEDIARLTETDNAHNRLSGPAAKKILEREWKVFGNEKFRRIAEISSSHIYNLRATRQYQSHALTVKKTHATNVPIGEREAYSSRTTRVCTGRYRPSRRSGTRERGVPQQCRRRGNAVGGSRLCGEDL